MVKAEHSMIVEHKCMLSMTMHLYISRPVIEDMSPADEKKALDSERSEF